MAQIKIQPVKRLFNTPINLMTPASLLIQNIPANKMSKSNIPLYFVQDKSGWLFPPARLTLSRADSFSKH